MSQSGDNMTENKGTGYRSVHVRLPGWLMERITAHAEEVGQSQSVEIRRALVEAFSGRQGCHCERSAGPDPSGEECAK